MTPERSEAPYGLRPPGHRLPERIRLGPVHLQVGDLDRSLAYYDRVLGLRPLEGDPGRDAEGGRVRLGTEHGGAGLVELQERPGAAPVPRGGRPGLYHFAILLPDRAALGRFARHLGGTGVPVGASDHRVSEALYLTDPDGLGIEVYADRPRDRWEHRDRQLLMSTDPLDVSALVEAGGEAPWTGMPEGTRMGHLHLHVGDLPAAEAFYHEVLGFDKVVWSYPGALFLSAGGYHHHLGLNTWARSSVPAGPDDARLLQWEVELPTAADAARALEALEGAGHSVSRDEVGGRVKDPWGTELRLWAAGAGTNA